MNHQAPRFRWRCSATVAQAIDWPLDRWPGNCYGVVSQIIKHGIVNGVAVYGHWLGPVSPECVIEDWRTPRPFLQHGWIKQPDGSIVDPTRFVFEAAEPYIYVGESDHYDEGGNQFRLSIMPAPPEYEGGLWDGEIPEGGYTFPLLNSDTWVVLVKLLDQEDRGYFTLEQAAWLANLPPAMLGIGAEAFYRSLEKEGRLAFVPFDNRIMVLGKGFAK